VEHEWKYLVNKFREAFSIFYYKNRNINFVCLFFLFEVGSNHSNIKKQKQNNKNVGMPFRLSGTVPMGRHPATTIVNPHTRQDAPVGGHHHTDDRGRDTFDD
jgi:macrodomain Ter protein organizer (MatP/YcbG family)